MKRKWVRKEDRPILLMTSNITYAYSTRSMVVHDKWCRYARSISEKYIKLTNEYPENVKGFCSVCGKQAILKYAVEDINNLGLYQKLFQKTDPKLLHKLYVEQGACSCWEKKNLLISCHEDDWMIQQLSDESIILLHNNYVPNGAGGRMFTDQWHQEKEDNLNAALQRISRYKYEWHKQNFKKKQLERMLSGDIRIDLKIGQSL